MTFSGETTRRVLRAILFVFLAAVLIPVQGRSETAVVTSYGGTIYVPALSHVAVSANELQPLAATLVIHNVDQKQGIVLTSVQYFGSDGEVLRSFVDTPVPLKPFQSGDFAIGVRENSGGAGANFVVAWTADEPVVEPVANAVMIGGTGTQGLSFRTDGFVIERHTEPAR